jgi:hypothetical protein
MNEAVILGDYFDPETMDFEGTLAFSIKAGYIEKKKIWKGKDITAEFFGNFWQTLLDDQTLQPTLHFICGELMENAVHHGISPDYLIRIDLCFKLDELMIYVKNRTDTKQIEGFKKIVRLLLETQDLKKLFIQRMKEAKKTGSKKSQVGLITIIKDRGAKLAWKIEPGTDETNVTTMARIPLKRKGRK